MKKTDKNTYIHELCTRAEAFVVARDWDQFHTPKELAANLSVEAAELLEVFIWKKDAEITQLLATDKVFRERLTEELGDVLLTTVLFARQAKIDLATAFYEKLKKTEKKYPIESAKGKNKKYTEL